MITQGVVVADTTPLNYLILIGQAGVLRELFGEVVIPDAVLSELRHPKAPAAVANWLLNPPDWLTVENVARIDRSGPNATGFRPMFDCPTAWMPEASQPLAGG